MRPDFEKNPLIPTVVQDAASGEVRMVGYQDREAWDATVRTGELHFHSRSRDRLWKKGETSGNVHHVVSMRSDCDGDAILVVVDPEGPTCHEGTDSCFQTQLQGRGVAPVLSDLEGVIAQRLAESPEGSYTASLAREGAPRIAQKVGEESVETIIAALSGSDAQVCQESADLLYHLLVLLVHRGTPLRDVLAVLRDRARDGSRRARDGSRPAGEEGP